MVLNQTQGDYDDYTHTYTYYYVITLYMIIYTHNIINTKHTDMDVIYYVTTVLGIRK